jgi:uncharacterized phage protein (TIGR01671 family)
MREIKFRGKRVDNGEWVQGYYYRIWDKHYILWGMTNDKPDMVEIIPETLGQDTGLKDKSGVEIYEGDIVSSKGVKLDVVEYLDREASYIVGCELLQAFVYGSAYPLDNKNAYVELEVIGNIHEEAKQ